MQNSNRVHVALLTVAALFAFGCKGAGGGSTVVSLTGSGSSFVNPLMSKWAAEYQVEQKAIRIILDKTVDFGASDAALSDEQLAKASPKIVHIPLTLGAVVVTYNVKDVPDHLKLTPEVIAGIFNGEIKIWNDGKIASLNPEMKLPAQPIGVVYRSDGSGTTAVFTDYLSNVSAPWKSNVGKGTTVKWPAGTGANGNAGVTNQVKQTPGSVGYVELAYALQNRLPVASLRNKAGKFVEPSLEAITAAAAGTATKIPEDLRMPIVDAEGEGAYPIAGFTYALVYEDMADPIRGAALTNFLWWGTHDGQKLGLPLHYAPLPASIVTKAEDKLKALRSGGKPLLTAK
jgi:phosphate transport system substrate-binding protein